VARQAEEETKAKTSPAPAGSDSGWIADFEQEGAPRAQFGAGWMVTTDAMAGGKSVGKMEVVAGGAEGSKGALRVTGEVMEGFAFPWSGVMFSPGPAPMQPANLSGHKAIQFWAKGDGQTYQVMMFTKKLGYRPAIQTFVAGLEWKQFTLTFAAFGDVDGIDIMAIAWAVRSACVAVRNRCAAHRAGAQKSQMPHAFCPSARSPKWRTNVDMRHSLPSA
jgi:hypothetical protein